MRSTEYSPSRNHCAGAAIAFAVAAFLPGVASAQIPPATPIPSIQEEARHVLNRLTFGYTPDGPNGLWGITSETELDAWILAQLAAPPTDYSNPPGGIADTLIKGNTSNPYLNEGAGLTFPNTGGWTKTELRAKQLILALESDYQLREVMTWFWEQHFSTYINTTISAVQGSDPQKEEKAVYHEWFENQQFRRYALADFYSLLRSSMESPAMRYYLNLTNSGGRGANEDYGREVVELHTVSPFSYDPANGNQRANYSTDDIQVLAEVFRGLNVNGVTGMPENQITGAMSSVPFWRTHWALPPATPLLQRDLFQSTPGQSHMDDWRWNSVLMPFSWPVSDADWHNELYSTQDGFTTEGILYNLVNQMETKRFICTKLIHWFVGDADSLTTNNQLQADLNALLQTCMSPAIWGTNGNINKVLETIFFSDVFRDTRRFEHLRTPLELAVAQARVLDARLTTANSPNKAALLARLTAIYDVIGATGATPHEHPSPDGFPLRSLRQPGSGVYWLQGTYASRIFTDTLAVTDNLPYDPEAVLRAEVIRRGMTWTNDSHVAKAALRLFYGSRYSGRDVWNARRFLNQMGGWAAVANDPATAPGLVRQMTAFLRALPQAMEK